jgi:hypothetical protein
VEPITKRLMAIGGILPVVAATYLLLFVLLKRI